MSHSAQNALRARNWASALCSVLALLRSLPSASVARRRSDVSAHGRSTDPFDDADAVPPLQLKSCLSGPR